MKEFSRSERVAEQVRAELAQALLREIDDPRLQNVSLMAVQMSDCLQYARVFWLPISMDELTPREKKGIERAFASATPFLRGVIAKKIDLRVVPEIRFEYDESVQRGRFMDDVIEQVRRRDAEDYPHLVEDETITSDDD